MIIRTQALTLDCLRADPDADGQPCHTACKLLDLSASLCSSSVKWE